MNNPDTNSSDLVLELNTLISNDYVGNEKTFIFISKVLETNNFFEDLDESFFQNNINLFSHEVQNEAVAYPILYNLLATEFTTQCAILRFNHSDWSNAKIYLEASKEMVHITLDVFGLVPVVGEAADLVNGVLYTIEGDGVNATLSYASAIPVVGWASAGTKFAIKVNNVSQTAYTVATKVKLTWKIVGNVVSFGERSQLRKVLGMGLSTVDPKQAHHLIPWSSQSKMAVQRAAKYSSAFHMNEALNGIAVAAWRNQPNHTAYNNLIDSKLDAFRYDFPNATPEQCYLFVTNLIQQIRTWVINHPNSHLNDLVLP